MELFEIMSLFLLNSSAASLMQMRNTLVMDDVGNTSTLGDGLAVTSRGNYIGLAREISQVNQDFFVGISSP